VVFALSKNFTYSVENFDRQDEINDNPLLIMGFYDFFSQSIDCEIFRQRYLIVIVKTICSKIINRELRRVSSASTQGRSHERQGVQAPANYGGITVTVY